MALQIVGLPGVSAFLQSILLDLDAVMKMAEDSYLDFNSQLKKLEEELFALQDVLVDGERRRFTETYVDRWMDDLKDFLYDADDLVEEIKMEKLQLQLDMNQVCSNFPINVYEIASVIKGSLEEVLRRVAELAQKAVDPLKLKRGACQHDANWVESQAMVRPKTGSCADESEIHGRKKDIDNIIDMLLVEDGGRSRKNYEVVCIVGMGGLGKTTVAQLVFQDERVQNCFSVKRWACVSDVFYVTKVMKDLIEFSEDDDGNSHKQSQAAVQNSLKSIIEGSKILVTTRQVKVAKVIGTKAPYQLGRLEDAHCQSIFNDNAFGEIDGSDEDVDLMKVGEVIVRKCGGVPLVAKLIGALLRGEDEGKWKAVKENDLWNLVFEDEDLHPGLRLSYFYLPPSLKRCFEYFALFPSDFEFDQGKLVRMWLAEGLIEVNEGRELEEIGSQYYNDLKARSLIQENDVMHDMVHHLACVVSGRFFFQTNSSCRSCTSSLQSVRHASIEDKSELLTDAHKLRTLIHKGGSCQEVVSNKMLRVLEIDSSRDLPSSIGSDLKHLRYLYFKDGFWYTGFSDSICTLKNLQILHISRCRYLKDLPQDIGKLSNLRFLGLTHASITTLPDSVCSLSNLRVLDLSYCERLTTLPNDIGNPQKVHVLRLGDLNSICMLSNLQVLNLSFCSKLSILPESVCNLVNLRVLDLYKCESLTTLPNDIGNLQRLQKLVMTTKIRLPESIVNATNLDQLAIWMTDQPTHLGKLTKLENLGCYRVGKEKGQGIDELKDMNRLKGRLIIWNMENIASVEEASLADLKSKKHIEDLKFKWKESDDDTYTKSDGEIAVRIMEVLEPNVALKHLTFKNYIGHKFPGWMSFTQFHKLTKLSLKDLPMVTKMEGMVFQSLKVLKVKNCPALMEISMTTSKLEEFKLLRCEKLKPAAIVLLPGLWDTFKTLECDYFHLHHFLQQLKATSASPCTKLEMLRVRVGVNYGMTIFPVGWPNIFTSLKILRLYDLPPTNFKIVSEEDHKLLESISKLYIDNCPYLVSLESLQLPPRLEGLFISDCPNLTNLPSGLRYLSSLQRITVHNCPNSEMSPDDLLPLFKRVASKIRNCPKLEEQWAWASGGFWKSYFPSQL